MYIHLNYYNYKKYCIQLKFENSFYNILKNFYFNEI